MRQPRRFDLQEARADGQLIIYDSPMLVLKEAATNTNSGQARAQKRKKGSQVLSLLEIHVGGRGEPYVRAPRTRGTSFLIVNF